MIFIDDNAMTQIIAFVFIFDAIRLFIFVVIFEHCNRILLCD